MGLVQPGVYWWNGSLDYVSVVYAVFALEFSAIHTVICPTLGLVQPTMHHRCLVLLSRALRVCILFSRLYTRCLHETTEYVFRITPSVDIRWMICVADVPVCLAAPCADMVDHMGVNYIAGLYSAKHHLTDPQQRMVTDRLEYSDVA